MLTENDPRVMPVRLSHAVCIDAALELIRGKEASAQRRRISEQTKNPPADPKAVEPPPEASTETPPRSEGS